METKHKAVQTDPSAVDCRLSNLALDSRINREGAGFSERVSRFVYVTRPNIEVKEFIWEVLDFMELRRIAIFAGTFNSIFVIANFFPFV